MLSMFLTLKLMCLSFKQKSLNMDTFFYNSHQTLLVKFEFSKIEFSLFNLQNRSLSSFL